MRRDHARGGDDTLVGGVGQGVILYGDARTLDGDSRGGNDTLIANSGSMATAFPCPTARAAATTSWSAAGLPTTCGAGDAQVIVSNAVSTGADTYVFAPGSGTDYIHDFRQGDHDKIDVRAYDFHDISELTIVGNAVEFDAFNRVVLVGFAGALHASDFIFA